MKIDKNWPKELKEFIKDFEPAPYANLTDEDWKRIQKLITDKNVEIEKLKKDITGLIVSAQVMCAHEDMAVETYYQPAEFRNNTSMLYTLKCHRCGNELFEVRV